MKACKINATPKAKIIHLAGGHATNVNTIINAPAISAHPANPFFSIFNYQPPLKTAKKNSLIKVIKNYSSSSQGTPLLFLSNT